MDRYAVIVRVPAYCFNQPDVPPHLEEGGPWHEPFCLSSKRPPFMASASDTHGREWALGSLLPSLPCVFAELSASQDSECAIAIALEEFA